MLHFASIRVLIVCCALAAPAFANQVWIVDPTLVAPPPGSFTAIQAAVAAAADGDVIVVKPGFDPAGFIIDGKSLTVVADLAGAPVGAVASTSSAEIRNLAANQKVLVRGLTLRGQASPTRVRLIHDAGAVVLEDVVVAVESSTWKIPDPMLEIVGSERVMVVRCTIHGRPKYFTAASETYPAGVAVAAIASTVSAYASSMRGGHGADAFVSSPFGTPSTAGAAALVLSGGTALVAGSALTGGAGGNGSNGEIGCFASSNGGPGVIVGGHLFTLDSAVQGGAGGTDSFGCPQVGGPGPAIQFVSGSIDPFAETLRTLAIDAPLIHEGGAGTLDVSGIPGESCVALLSTAVGVDLLPAAKGTLLCGLPAFPIVLGPIPATGILSCTASIPSGALPPGTAAFEVYAQALFAGAGGGVLSSPSATVVAK